MCYQRISLFSGIPYNTIVITIPQRFQAVYGTSPLGAGVRLIPFNFLIAFASVFVNILAAKARIKPIYLLFIGSMLQLIGLALFTTLTDDTKISAAIYGYEIISGFGVGMVIGICLIIPPHVVKTRDLGMLLLQSTKSPRYNLENLMLIVFFTTAVASGALLQSRMFGGALGLAVASNVLNNHLRSSLTGIISAETLDALLQSTASIQLLPPEMQRQVLAAFSDGYNLQMKIMTGFAGAQLLTVGLLWRKNQISVVGEQAELDAEVKNLEKTDKVEEPLRTT